MTQVQGIFDDVTPQAIEQANKLIAFLAERIDPDWVKILQGNLTPSELDLNLGAIAATLTRLKIEKPMGAIASGTGLIKADAGLEGEDAQRAIRLLKSTFHLIQAGKGRGKVLVLVHDKPLTLEEFDEWQLGVDDLALEEVNPTILLDLLGSKMEAMGREIKRLRAELVKAQEEKKEATWT